MARRSVIHIVWSPRRIEQSLRALENLGLETAFICGYYEHEGCDVASQIVRETNADVYLLSYDDHVPTREQVDLVLRLQDETGDVVSGWHLPGQNSPYAAGSRPSWGAERYLELTDECFYYADEVRSWPEELVPTVYCAALTCVPRDALVETPFRALSHYVESGALEVWPSRTGAPYDKGCCSDWTLAVDLVKKGRRIWLARDAEILHLAPLHGVPAYKFWMHEDEPGVYWNERPRPSN